MITLTQRIGDTVSHRIQLRWGGRAFDPTGFSILFTVKADADADADAAAKIQKRDGGFGITVSGSSALVQLLPVDTAGDANADPVIPALTPGTYDWDIQSQSESDPEDVRTVANGRLVLTRDVTRGTEAAIPVYVADPGITYDTKLLTYS